MNISKEICPVPFDQQPFNEFYALKNSYFFSFFGINDKRYLYSILLFFCLPIMASSLFTNIFDTYEWLKLLILFSIASMILLTLILVRLYLGWSYLIKRLLSASIFYEESGWYDGQIWIKTPEMLTKDRLIADYYIEPFLKRVRYTILLITVINIFVITIHGLLYS